MRMSLIIFCLSSGSQQLVVYYVHFGRENQTNNNRVGLLKTLNSWISALHHPTTSREQCNWTTCKVRQRFKYIPSYSPNSTTPTPTFSIQWDIIFAPTPTTYQYRKTNKFVLQWRESLVSVYFGAWRPCPNQWENQHFSIHKLVKLWDQGIYQIQ